MDAIRNQRSPAAHAKAPGWDWDPEQGAYAWWDGRRYTSRATPDDSGNVQLLPQFHEPATGVGWKWIPQENAYLWWDGERYTERAEWDGTQWQVRPPAAGGRTRSGMKPSTQVIVYGLVGLAIAVFFDLVILMMVANTPADEQLMTEETALGMLAVTPIAGLVVGAAVGWINHKDG